MSYFPDDIPFMSDNELKENGIRIPKEASDTNVGDTDLIERKAAIDALDVLCQEHRYKIPGKVETYSQYNEAWQDALDRAEGAIGNLPSAQPERKTGRWILVHPLGEEDGYLYSECKNGWWNNKDWNFCPNCGANMREESNDNN